MIHPSPQWIALASCLVFGACKQTDGYIQLASSSNANSQVSIVGSSDESQWEYLAAKYDTNADKQITSAEYDRSAKAFAAFDRDNNGVLEAADFKRGKHDDEPGMSSMRNRISPMVLAKYFQSDQDETVLVRREIAGAFLVFDSDKDGRLTRFEFEKESARRGAPSSRRMDRFGMLTASVAGDNVHDFGLAELLTYFDSVAKDGKLMAPMTAAAPKPSRAKTAEVHTDNTASAQGKLAPDFTLPMLHAEAGDQLVQLSSFRGKKPVALIFGSYT